jgi:hypothetical protein
MTDVDVRKTERITDHEMIHNWLERLRDVESHVESLVYLKNEKFLDLPGHIADDLEEGVAALSRVADWLEQELDR